MGGVELGLAMKRVLPSTCLNSISTETRFGIFSYQQWSIEELSTLLK